MSMSKNNPVTHPSNKRKCSILFNSLLCQCFYFYFLCATRGQAINTHVSMLLSQLEGIFYLILFNKTHHQPTYIEVFRSSLTFWFDISLFLTHTEISDCILCHSKFKLILNHYFTTLILFKLNYVYTVNTRGLEHGCNVNLIN